MTNEIMSADHNVFSNAFGPSTQIHQGDTVIHNYGPNASRKAHFVLPFPPNEDIIHRPEIVTQLDELLTRSKDGHYCSAALWGLGGSGKTQIALHYAHRRSHKDPACDVFWVHADNETSFARDYQKIARKLSPDCKVDGEELFLTVCDRIQSLQRWLLILDNADDLTLFGVGVGGQIKSLIEYIPQGPGGTVLWTSRDEQIVSLVGPLRGVQVSRMGIEEAENLLAITRKESTRDDEIQDAKLLLQELQWLPLAISQAGSYMRRTSMPIKRYLSKLLEGKNRWNMLKQSQHDRHRRPNVSNSVLETWNISILHIRQESETTYKVLHTIAYLDSEKIPLSLVLAASKDNSKKPEQEASYQGKGDGLKMAIIRLKEFSFISERKAENGDEPSFDMHKLVQDAIRYQLNTDGTTVETYFATAALRVVASLFPKEITIETIRLCEKYATHAIQVSDWADLSEDATTTTSFLIDVAEYFGFCGATKKAEYMTRRTFDLMINNPSKTYPLEAIYLLYNVIEIYISQERYEEAKRWTLEAAAMLEKVFGEDDDLAVTTESPLISIYRHHGLYKEAEELQTMAILLRRKLFGEKDARTISAMAELASIYEDQKRYDKAKELKINTLALYSEVLGERHPATVDAMGSLAETYILTGNTKEAEELDFKLLSLGQDFSWGRYTKRVDLRDLVIPFSEIRLVGKTTSTRKRILLLLQELLGERNILTTCAMRSLAASYLYEKDRELRFKGVELHLKATTLTREIFGDNDEYTIKFMAVTSSICHSQGLIEEGKRLELEAMSLLQNMYGDTPPQELQLKFNKMATLREGKSVQDRAIWEWELLELQARTLEKIFLVLLLVSYSIATIATCKLLESRVPRLTRENYYQVFAVLIVLWLVGNSIATAVFFRSVFLWRSAMARKFANSKVPRT